MIQSKPKYIKKLLMLTMLFSAETALSCDGSHGEFSVPGLIIDSESNRFALSLTASRSKTSEDGLVKTSVFSLSYTRQLESELQVGIQVPIFNTTSSLSSNSFIGDIKGFLFKPISIMNSEFSGVYGKVTVPNSGSGHELGHTKAESDGSFSLTSGLFALKLLPQGFDFTTNFDVSYNLPANIKAPSVGRHTQHTNPEASPSEVVTDGEKRLSGGIGYSANIGFGFTPIDSLTRFGLRLGHTHKPKKTLNDEKISGETKSTVSFEAVRGLSRHGYSIGFGITKGLNDRDSMGINTFYQVNF